MNGYSTAMFGKAHFTPMWETSPAGPILKLAGPAPMLAQYATSTPECRSAVPSSASPEIISMGQSCSGRLSQFVALRLGARRDNSIGVVVSVHANPFLLLGYAPVVRKYTSVTGLIAAVNRSRYISSCGNSLVCRG